MIKNNSSIITRVCKICGKKPSASNNRPHSLHKTKRSVYPNLQKSNGRLVCTRCLKNILS